LKILAKNLHYLKKTTPYGEIFKTVSKRFTISPIDILCVNFLKFGRPEIGKVMHYLPHKRNKILPHSLALASARIVPKI